jgi:rod shape-determining protein MreD
MNLLFAAIGATITALLETTLAPHVTVGHANLHPVLVVGVIWTIAAGLDRGFVWAFVGGLVLDTLLGRPLGASAFALLVAVGGAAAIAKPLPRLRTLAPIVAVPVLSLVYSMLLYVLTSAAQGPGAPADPVSLFIPGAVYDGLLGLLVGPLAVSIHDRRTVVERLAW